ncbi:hypothetical protein NL676_037309 [Syzygium grande]|nr:hypothetical protein NL676_037309 [Syzygium grande]
MGLARQDFQIRPAASPLHIRTTRHQNVAAVELTPPPRVGLETRHGLVHEGIGLFSFTAREKVSSCCASEQKLCKGNAVCRFTPPSCKTMETRKGEVRPDSIKGRKRMEKRKYVCGERGKLTRGGNGGVGFEKPAHQATPAAAATDAAAQVEGGGGLDFPQLSCATRGQNEEGRETTEILGRVPLPLPTRDASSTSGRTDAVAPRSEATARRIKGRELLA